MPPPPSSLSSSTTYALQRQRDLEASVRRLFPGNEKIQVNVRREASIRDTSSGLHLELDIWLPEKHLAFEFQDPYHYVTTWYSNTSIEGVRVKDIKKSEGAQKRAESLIVVPCWWDGRDESLIATIREQRPDLFAASEAQGASPIPFHPPSSYFNTITVPGVGELMVPSFSRSVYFSPTHWWMAEKYDGLRACWNPKSKVVYTRRGGTIGVPTSFMRTLPGAFLDGEIWLGRGSFQESQRVYGHDDFVNWAFLRFVAFDWPDVFGQSFPFEERFDLLLASIPPAHPFVISEACMRCKGKQSVRRLTDGIMTNGGEGVVLRKPHSSYIHGRTDELIKFKATRLDQEGFVIGAELSYYLIKLPSGVVFKVAKPLPSQNNDHKNESDHYVDDEGNLIKKNEEKSNEVELVAEETEPSDHELKAEDRELKTRDEERGEEDVESEEDNQELKIGDVVTFSYTKFSANGRPVNAKDFRVRRDLKWEHVLEDFANDVPRALSENSVTHASLSQPQRQPHGHWTVDEGENCRQFFEDFAKKANIDPLAPEDWYPITLQRVLEEKHGNAVLAHYNNSLKRALISIYPNIGLDESKFHTVTRNYWNSVENRRRFFNSFAMIRGFDPLVSTNWRDIKQEDVVREKGGVTVLDKYSRSLPRALVDIYPEFRNDPWFISSLKNRTYNLEQRREFFDGIAKTRGFDPLVSENWLHVDTELIDSQKIGKLILNMYEGSLNRALRNTYSNFDSLQRPVNYWKTVANRKKFFDDYAEAHNFDPLVPDNWYAIPASEFLQMEARSFLHYHNFSVKQALAAAYPNIGFQLNQFISLRRSHRNNKQSRAFFDVMAKKYNFDPLKSENWFLTNRETVLTQPGGSIIMARYSDSIPRALMDAYPELNMSPFDFRGIQDESDYWSFMVNRKQFFDAFARKSCLDPLIPSHWYQFNINHVIVEKGGMEVMVYYNFSLPGALMHLYPNIGLSEVMFSPASRKSWSVDVRRNILENMAISVGFSSTPSAAWKSVSKDQLQNHKVASKMLAYCYNGSLHRALAHLYPQL